MLDLTGNTAAGGTNALAGIAAIISALAWPTLVLVVLIWFREPLSQLAKASVEIATTASKFKFWQFEFERDVKQQLDVSTAAALASPVTTEITPATQPISRQTEFRAANRVNQLIIEAPTQALRGALRNSIRERMISLAQEYDSTRANMAPGVERTRAMNVIAAKMRTLGLASLPFIEEFRNDQYSPGKRLAAICILEIEPDSRYAAWLADRVGNEQPFVFYHASIALLNLVQKLGKTEDDQLRPLIQSALDRIKGFNGKPDANTISILEMALSNLASREDI